MVDNCYGEFTQTIEPTDVGADMCVGSLIKNPGGGLAPIGGYIVGKKGLRGKCCLSFNLSRTRKRSRRIAAGAPFLYQGLFLAPTVTAGALKGAIFCGEPL